MARLKANILFVDDQPANLVVLEALLSELDQNLVMAHSGEEALKRVLAQDFALILMDAQMPRMDGFETADLIRQRKKTRFTPIIFVTAYELTDAQVFRGYSVGAVDLLFKPIIPEILRSKVSVFVELFHKTEEIKRQADLLLEKERHEYEMELIEERRRHDAERLQEKLRAAREIQQRLFPEAPPRCAGFDIYGASFPSDITGGDYYDFLPLEGEAVGIAIGDVSGHGFGPSLLMAATRAYVRALSLTRAPLGDVLTLANRALAMDVGEGDFVSLLLARLELATGSLAYASAGHPPGYVLTKEGAVKSVLESTGFPLGLFSETRFQESVANSLLPGDLLFLFTDGVPEASAPDGRRLGMERTLETIRAHRHKSAEEIVHALYATVCEFAVDPGTLDDITAVVVKKQ